MEDRLKKIIYNVKTKGKESQPVCIKNIIIKDKEIWNSDILVYLKGTKAMKKQQEEEDFNEVNKNVNL